jgi:hypothetical protein
MIFLRWNGRAFRHRTFVGRWRVLTRKTPTSRRTRRWEFSSTLSIKFSVNHHLECSALVANAPIIRRKVQEPSTGISQTKGLALEAGELGPVSLIVCCDRPTRDLAPVSGRRGTPASALYFARRGGHVLLSESRTPREKRYSKGPEIQVTAQGARYERASKHRSRRRAF